MRSSTYLTLSLLLIVYLGCTQSHHFEYQGEIPDLDYTVTIGSWPDASIDEIEGDSILMRNRIYIDVDTTGVLRLNGHAILLDDFERYYQYILTNPDQLIHLPESPSDAVIFPSVEHQKLEDGNNIFSFFPFQVISSKVASISMDLMLLYLADELKLNWTDVDMLTFLTISEKFSPNVALPKMSSTDRDIQLTMPDEKPIEDFKERNVLRVIVNEKNELIVEGEQMEIEQLTATTKTFIQNPDKDENLAESPQKAVISLQNERGTSYDIYLAVYNELKRAYDELWEMEAQTRFKKATQKLIMKKKE